MMAVTDDKKGMDKTKVEGPYFISLIFQSPHRPSALWLYLCMLAYMYHALV